MCLSRKGELDEIMACEICSSRFFYPLFTWVGCISHKNPKPNAILFDKFTLVIRQEIN